ncbi:hypothetical protein CR983_02000 [Candidatus Saccharibacteria bacterium]|nr:MAG: hypothetical protein CR983_02000 [Candidatus Saccharibacteria bacterium]
MTDLISIHQAREAVDACLADVLAKRCRQAAQISPKYQRLWQTIEHVAMAGGKRFRPYLTMMSYGTVDEKITPIAAAQELLHVATLMHDDVIDQDTMRHGQLNVSGEYQNIYDDYIDDGRRAHYANSAAIIAGDLLIAEAYQQIAMSSFDPGIISKLHARLTTSIFEVVGGQLLDVETGFMPDEPISPLLVYRYKTASYSFAGPLLAGGYCTAASDETIALLEQFAMRVGVAFQVQDDLLGVFGDESEIGKPTLGDLREGKQTLLVRYHLSLMDEAQRARFEVFGNPAATAEQLQAIQQDMQASGAKMHAEKMVAEYFDDAEAMLGDITDDGLHARLAAFVGMLRGRKA